LGAVLRAGRNAAKHWHQLLSESELLQPLQKPELDIVAYFARTDSLAKIDEISQTVFEQAANTERADQIHLATYMMKSQAFADRGFALQGDELKAKILRSVLMKPEHEYLVPKLHARVESLVSNLL
jgi:hypothetical protein